MLAVVWVGSQFILIPINSVLTYIIKGKFTDENVFPFIVEYPFEWIKKISPDHEQT